MSKTSLYKIVNSKEQLIRAIIDYLMEIFQREVDEVPEAKISRSKRNCVGLSARTREHSATSMTLMQFGIDEGAFRSINIAVLQRYLLVMSEALTDVKFLEENNLTYAQAVESMSDWRINGFLRK